MKTNFYETKVVIIEDEAKEIETNTKNLAESELWITRRQKRLTASWVGNIAKMRKKQYFITSTFRASYTDPQPTRSHLTFSDYGLSTLHIR